MTARTFIPPLPLYLTHSRFCSAHSVFLSFFALTRFYCGCSLSIISFTGFRSSLRFVLFCFVQLCFSMPSILSVHRIVNQKSHRAPIDITRQVFRMSWWIYHEQDHRDTIRCVCILHCATCRTKTKIWSQLSLALYAISEISVRGAAPVAYILLIKLSLTQ